MGKKEKEEKDKGKDKKEKKEKKSEKKESAVVCSNNNNNNASHHNAFPQNFVIFFPDPKLPCKFTLEGTECKYKDCNFTHDATSLLRFITTLRQAQSTLDCCVFTITCDEIANELVKLHARGVRVRVITDDEQIKTQGSDAGRLKQAGIEVKVDNAQTHMHHKFAIIDKSVVLTGSFNWTRQAVIGNQESVLVTSISDFVNPYCLEFEKLWSNFHPL